MIAEEPEPAAAPAPMVAETRVEVADIPADEAVAISTPAEETPAPAPQQPRPGRLIQLGMAQERLAAARAIVRALNGDAPEARAALQRCQQKTPNLD